MATDVVDLADASSFENREDCATVIFYMQPITLLQPITVNWQRLVPECIRNEQRQEFFGKLKGTVIVRRARDQCREVIRTYIRIYEEVCGAFRGRVGTAWSKRGALECKNLGWKVTVNFVGRDMEEA